jgi:hypothetical protein
MIGAYIAYRIVNSKIAYTPEQRIGRVIFTGLVVVAVILALQAATPHYMPKHTIKRSTVPAPELVEGEIKNIQPQPVSGDERDAKREEAYKQTLPFVEQNK